MDNTERNNKIALGCVFTILWTMFAVIAFSATFSMGPIVFVPTAGLTGTASVLIFRRMIRPPT